MRHTPHTVDATEPFDGLDAPFARFLAEDISPDAAAVLAASDAYRALASRWSWEDGDPQPFGFADWVRSTLAPEPEGWA